MKKTISQSDLEKYRMQLLYEEKSPVTIEKYLRDASAFAVFAKGREISKDLTLAFKKHLEERNYAVRSINSMIASLNSFLSFMGLSDCKLRNLRCQRRTYCKESKELTKAEYLRLLEASKKRIRLNLVLQTICGTGIRVSELKYFTVEAVKSGEVSVRCKNKIRTILVPGKLKKILLDYARKKGITSGAVFVTSGGKPLDRSNIWAEMKKLCGAAGVNPSKVFPHNLRKLFARTFYSIEKDIAKLADILGHGSIETTRIYIMTTGTEHRKKMERLGLVI
ncbi:MAG: tyrosine-type recombinase/integrase [Oscillospiraceae bacterium]|nr:tyrosine-type recombinase/integrase [Oscillospiraceae bacterium]